MGIMSSFSILKPGSRFSAGFEINLKLTNVYLKDQFNGHGHSGLHCINVVQKAAQGSEEDRGETTWGNPQN